ncbi:hypothetical protein MLD38_023478 [Melastoma candidum]|uniref:Uncharacterized protein n=1 Tax=Melastoma candidum TaxID=119954 RepID=A0ACB9NPL4_9MYRT|nr:hypothetical protein MLD38_023478 [Melastoma candidum]
MAFWVTGTISCGNLKSIMTCVFIRWIWAMWYWLWILGESLFHVAKVCHEERIVFPLSPAKDFWLNRKIEDWLIEFQKLPYVSP